MYRIVACDLDETLLRLDRTIGAEDIRAVKEAVSRGVRFVPATGRGYNSVQGTLKELGLYGRPGQYVLSYNGGAITENAGNRLLHFEGLSFETADELYRRGLSYDVCIHVYTLDMVYIFNLTQDEIDYQANRMEITVVDWQDLSLLKGQPIAKVLYTNTDRAYLNRIAEELADITGDLDVSYSSNRYLEFNPRGVNKGTGLMRLADLCGVDLSETVAIGDNFNDLPMIRAAGLGVGVANTVPEMKDLCGIITKATCDECAVAEVLNQYVLV